MESGGMLTNQFLKHNMQEVPMDNDGSDDTVSE
jgi:hypothetical protein